MKRIAYSFLLAALLSSCASKRYSIATRGEPSSDYRIISVRDSGLLIVPWKYNYELTPEVIREYGRVVPFDSLTQLRRASSSGVAEALLGVPIGDAVGATVGFIAGTLLNPRGDEDAIAVGAGIGSLLGLVIGPIVGYLARPLEMDMLPIVTYKKFLRSSAYYSRIEQDTLQIRH